MARRRAWRYMIKDGNVWFARFQLPKDVHHLFGGRRAIYQTTGCTDPVQAQMIAFEKVALWKQEVEAARSQGVTKIERRAREIVMKYRQLGPCNAQHGDFAAQLDVVRFTLEQIGIPAD